jgi:hypothetical protein
MGKGLRFFHQWNRAHTGVVDSKLQSRDGAARE